MLATISAITSAILDEVSRMLPAVVVRLLTAAYIPKGYEWRSPWLVTLVMRHLYRAKVLASAQTRTAG